jgi:hypothetical protein
VPARDAGRDGGAVVTSALGLLPRLDGLSFGHRNDRGQTPAVARDVRDPAAYGGVVDGLGKPRAKFAEPFLGTCGRWHTHMVTEEHLGAYVYTNLVGCEAGEAAAANALTC